MSRSYTLTEVVDYASKNKSLYEDLEAITLLENKLKNQLYTLKQRKTIIKEKIDFNLEQQELNW